MSGYWKLFSVGFELRKQGNVFVIARDAREAIDVAEDQRDIEHLGDFGEPEYDEPIEVDLTAEAVAKIAREEWAGPPYLADEAPGELDVDMNRLVAALEALQGDVDKTPGTRAYQERLEAAGQQRLDLAGAS